MLYISKYLIGVVVFIFLLILNVPANAVDINVAVGRAPVTLDPRFATDAASVRVLKLIAPGIISLNQNFEPTSLYLSYFGHKKYQSFFMELKDNVTYSDGSPVTIEALQAYYSSILNPELKSPLKGAFEGVESINIENGKRLVIHLKEPNPFFWGVLETSVVKLTGHEATQPIGMGLYQLDSIDSFGNVTVSRLDGFQSIHFNVIKDPVVRYLKLAKGGIDIIHNDVSEEILRYAKNEGFLVHEAPSTSYTYMGFLLENGKTADVKVRQALSYAINRGRIVQDLLGSRAKPALSLLSTDNPAYYAAEFEAFNPQKAGELLDDAGYTLNEQGERFELRLAITSNPFIQRLAQVIQQDLANIGVKVVISSSEWGTFYGNIKKGNFESYILTWVGRFQSDIYRSLFHSDMMPPNGANRGRYNNPLMDKLLEDLMREIDDKKRYALSKEVQKLQEQDMIYLPLWKRSHVAITSPNVTGYELLPDGGYEGLLNVHVKRPL